jgi:WXG100 family type VII secretion target
MAEHVEINYETVQGIRSTFAQQSQDITNMYQKLAGQADTLRGGAWVGRGASAFYGEFYGEMLPAVQRLIGAMEEAQNVAGKVMQSFKQAEEEMRGCWDPHR